MYRIVRYFFKGRKRVIESNVTLQDAQDHCHDPETNSKTCKTAKRKRYTKLHGEWFDGYERM